MHLQVTLKGQQGKNWNKSSLEIQCNSKNTMPFYTSFSLVSVFRADFWHQNDTLIDTFISAKQLKHKIQGSKTLFDLTPKWQRPNKCFYERVVLKCLFDLLTLFEPL